MGHFGRLAAGLALLAGTALTAITAFTAPTAAAAPAPAATASSTTVPSTTAPSTTGPSTTAPSTTGPRLDHVFLIMEENNSFQGIIGNKVAPNINYLANTFGLETNYFGVSPCCSEANYVQLLSGRSWPTVQSDDAYWKNQVVGQANLISQLDGAGVSWKAYLQSLPYAGYQGICYPAKCNGAPDADPLYVAKHDGIQNFTVNQNQQDWSRQVPIGQLGTDLKSGAVPRFSYVIPDECHDMHGDPPYCQDSGSTFDPQNQRLVSVGDAYLGQLVSQITHAGFWARGNNAIIVTWDEGTTHAGCCDAVPGAGQVATIVVTSHGPRGVQDNTPANHYSTLRSIELAYGLGCINNACDTKNVTPLSDLLEVTGSKPLATTVLPDPVLTTPTPSQPPEPLSYTTNTPSAAGWTVSPTQLLGTSDNSIGAIAGSSPSDIWAVGDYLPDATGSNVDATLSFAEHYDGKAWTVVRTPNAGPNYNTFEGVTAAGGEAWAVGEHLNAAYQDRALVEVWNGGKWQIADVPQPGSQRDILFGASAPSKNDVWVVGDQESGNGLFETLAEHWDGHDWSVVPTPDPGSAGNHLYAVDAVSANDVWAVGEQLGSAWPDQALVEHWDGHQWSVVPLPSPGSSTVLLDGVAANSDGSQVAVVGEVDSAAGGGQPFAEQWTKGHGWTVAQLPALPAGTRWSNLYGVTFDGGSVYADGTFVNPSTDANQVLLLKGAGGPWSVVGAPNPGGPGGSDIAGGLANIDGTLWMSGMYSTAASHRLPLVEHT